MNRDTAPIGIILIKKCLPRRLLNISQEKKDFLFRSFVLGGTFIGYTAFHMSRKPLSVVKTVLHQNCSTLHRPPEVLTNDTTWCDWAPFDKPNADEKLGILDLSFLIPYALAMFVSGPIAERVNLRYFLAFGMLLSGITTYLFGVAQTYGIHNMNYFILVQIAGGIVQSTGWPSVVTCVGNWFGKGRRGLIFGIWNSHTSVGNILGSVIAGAFVTQNWGLSFMVPGFIIGIVGFLTFLFLVADPLEVGCSLPDHHGDESKSSTTNRRQPSVNRRKDHASNDEEDPDIIYSSPAYSEDERPLLSDSSSELSFRSGEEIKAISISAALKIPGVCPFSLSLFFAKLVSYTFLYWLPKYISVSTTLTAAQAANLSTIFDIGGIIGGIIAGIISDSTRSPAATCTFMLLGAVPMLFIYQAFAHISLTLNIICLLLCGILVNGPYSLITTAVSAELGTHKSLRGNSKALATVTSIIDGTGSMGAAMGPLFAGYLSTFSDWKYVFYMLMASDLMAVVFLLAPLKREIRRVLMDRVNKRHLQTA